jgi:hypothetical protein
MRRYVSALIVFLFLTGIAIGAVGDSGVSDGISSVQPGQAYLAGSGMSSSPTAYPAQASDFSQGSGYPQQNKQAAGYQSSSGYQPSSSASQTYASVAPQTGGPYEERMSADDLRLSQPQAESFQPDSNLNFASATPPSVPEETYAYGTVQGTGQDAGQETGSWYYPGSVTSRNKFKVQTFSGLKTVAGCSYGGYLPLWSDINAAGNFYVYEWYPGQWTPSVRWWGWTWPGYKKGWFTGDVPGWHILCYNCRDWSNYVYIYVWPSGSGAYSSGSGSSYGSSSGYGTGTPSAAISASSPMPTGAPTPPDPNAENLILPDFNLLTPSTGQSGYAASPTGFAGAAGTVGPAGTTIAGAATSAAGYPSGYPSQSAIKYPVQGTAAGYSASYPTGYLSPTGYSQGIYPAGQSLKGIQPSQSCPGCMASVVAGTAAGGAGAIPTQKTCAACADQGSYSGIAVPSVPSVPSGQGIQPYQAVSPTHQVVSQTYKAVFPKSSTCRCNEYYVQEWPNKLSTVGAVRCGEWLPLWSKLSQPGIYWSFEWTLCGSPAGYYCQPEVKNFGYKNAGWHQTWFRGNKPGWHILSYCSGDYSNYIYIYVWPSS